MKKKTKLIISALSVLFVTALVIGTVAYFSKSFSSDGNTAYAASFDVDVVNADGITIGDGQFNLGDDLYPGMDPIEAYSFEINKNNTELPVEYQVNLTPSGDLFPQDGSSPILVTMQQNIDGEWVEIDYSKTFKPENDTEAFKIFVEWPHGDNDIDFQGMTGNFHLGVVATQVDPEEEPEVTEIGQAHVSLFKDSTSSTNKIDFENIKNFKLVNKETGKEYSEGTSKWNNKGSFEMEGIPVGEYTFSFETLPGMSIKEIQLGESYKETIYDSETNPLVIINEDSGKKSYAKIILQSELTLKEIKPLDDLVVSKDITLEAFKEALAKHAIIVDSTNQEHQVDLKWDIRPFVFNGWKKPGTYNIKSEFFKLPVNISNTVPSQRLEVALKVVFE